jgi:hypothetical protein
MYVQENNKYLESGVFIKETKDKVAWHERYCGLNAAKMKRHSRYCS